MSKTRVDDDGITMEWDEEKKGWFPKLDDEFIYKYNLNYGFTQESTSEEQTESKLQEETKIDSEQEAKKNEELQEIYAKFSEKCLHDKIDVQNLSVEEYNKIWYSFYHKFKPDTSNEQDASKDKKKGQKRNNDKRSEPAWFSLDESKNRHIYVENLPKDITMEEFIEFVSKAGMLMKDPVTNQIRAKLYKDAEGKLKGDGIACYIKIESVDIALYILDEYLFRGTHKVRVTRAEFQLKGDFDPKRRRRLTNKEKKMVQKKQEKLFSWNLDLKGTRPAHHNTVIIKNCFDVEKIKKNPDLLSEVQEFYENAMKQILPFKKMVVHELNPDAVIQVGFRDPNLSDVAVEYFNNKVLNNRSLTAELWDGRTKYRVKETEEEAAIRRKEWDESLGIVYDSVNPDSTKDNNEDDEDKQETDEKVNNDLSDDSDDGTLTRHSRDATPEGDDVLNETSD